MGKRTRGKKADAPRPRRGRRPQDRLPDVSPSESDPLHIIAEALADEHPMPLLMLASSFISSATPSRPSPFRPEPDADLPTLDDLVSTFLTVDRPEARALLTAIAALVDDDLMRRRIDRDLAPRPGTSPEWLDGLRAADGVAAAFEMVHVLGDADNVAVGVRVPPDHDLSVMVLVDHNLGTVVKDVMTIPVSPSEFARSAQAAGADADITLRPVDPADARARLEDAIRTGSMMFPPIETDTWPAARPLVEWMLRLLPAGGSLSQRPQWDDNDLAAVTDRFFASPFGAGMDDADRRSLLESLLWFGTDYGPGDPLRWSAQAVEIVLADWIPRKIVADVEYLTQAPDLLRAWIRFCHDERDIPETLTAETLAVVDALEAEYQRTIRSPRPQGPAALLAALGMADGDGMIGTGIIEAIMRPTLHAAVGGEQALEHLSTDPLPDEDFDASAVPENARERVGEILTLVDRYCDELFDVECRTACRRLLARLAARAPERLRRGRADTAAAAATCWIVAKVNRLFDGTATAKDFAAHVGLGVGSVSQRGKALLTDLGVDVQGYDLDLGTPDLLTSARRAEIATARDSLRGTAAALGAGTAD